MEDTQTFGGGGVCVKNKHFKLLCEALICVELIKKERKNQEPRIYLGHWSKSKYPIINMKKKIKLPHKKFYCHRSRSHVQNNISIFL